jgi:hypothetical protein
MPNSLGSTASPRPKSKQNKSLKSKQRGVPTLVTEPLPCGKPS